MFEVDDRILDIDRKNAVTGTTAEKNGRSRREQLLRFLDSNITKEADFVIEQTIRGRVGTAPAGKINLNVDSGMMFSIDAHLVSAFSLVRLPANGASLYGNNIHVLIDFWNRWPNEEARVVLTTNRRAKICGHDQKFLFLMFQPGLDVSVALERIKSYKVVG